MIMDIFCLGVCVVFLLLAAGNMSRLVNLPVHGDIGKTGDLRIWLVICSPASFFFFFFFFFKHPTFWLDRMLFLCRRIFIALKLCI